MPDYNDTFPYDNPTENDPLANDRPTEPMPPLRPEDMTIRLPGGSNTPTMPATAPAGRPPRDPRRVVISAVVAVILMAALGAGGIILFSGKHGTTACAACGQPTVPVATATRAPTSTVAPTAAVSAPTAATITTCAAAGFVQAGAATTGSDNFIAVPFPAGSVTLAPKGNESTGAQLRDIPTCTPGITTAAQVATTFGASITKGGWQSATPPNAATQACGDLGCWQQADKRFTPAVMQYVSLTNATITGNIATYTVHLAIMPIFTGTAAPLNNNSTFNFDQAPLPELKWDATLHLNGNTLAALLPAGSYDATTYATLNSAQTAFTHIAAIPVTQGQACALKSTSGFFIKFFIQGVNASQTQITLTYIVYPYGF